MARCPAQPGHHHELDPIDWFIVLFGLSDASGRLPVLLYAPMIRAGLVALIEARAPRRLWPARSSRCWRRCPFIAALGFNDTYHEEFDRHRLPANIDFLAMAGARRRSIFPE